jgi:hypothetical protein
MPATHFIVRAVVASELRDKFDHWYATDHLPWACRAFKCDRAWRAWSTMEEGVHYAVYRFADKAACDAALGSADFKALVADFDKAWPSGVSRTRDIVTLVQERGAS